MKKILFGVFAGLILAAFISISSCKKDDTAAPVISLSGANPYTLSLNSTYSDPGATASDDEDGTVSVTVDASAVNEDLTGTYIVHYSASDAAGNIGMGERTVIVKNDADYLAGSYVNAYDTCSSTPASIFDATVTASTTVNRKISIGNFGAFGTAITVDLSVDAAGIITGINLPQSLGGGTQLDVIYSTNPASSVISQSSPVQFKIHYHWIDASSNFDECISTYTR
ncbi:MAG TPA: immunoglobulin-like domain-containing protein [Bacteroidia bacterium]|nr:immunoglobulin-like domain-containing protein [Bacteroidia bacterium]